MFYLVLLFAFSTLWKRKINEGLKAVKKQCLKRKKEKKRNKTFPRFISGHEKRSQEESSYVVILLLFFLLLMHSFLIGNGFVQTGFLAGL